jgi:hypothetical protein
MSYFNLFFLLLLIPPLGSPVLGAMPFETDTANGTEVLPPAPSPLMHSVVIYPTKVRIECGHSFVAFLFLLRTH